MEQRPDVKKMCRDCGNEYMGVPSGRYCPACRDKRNIECRKKSNAKVHDKKRSNVLAAARMAVREWEYFRASYVGQIVKQNAIEQQDFDRFNDSMSDLKEELKGAYNV